MLTRFIKIQLVLFTILTAIAIVALGWYYLRVPSLVGIGQYKLRWLGLEQPEPVRELQRRIKELFDPAGILNPGKAI